VKKSSNGADAPKLSRRERECLDILYRNGEATVSEVQGAMADAPSYSAVRATLNVLVAAERVIVPLQPEYYALEGITYLMATIDRVKASLNPDLTVEGIVLTMWDPRNRLAHQVADEVNKHFRVFKSIIPRNVRLSEAPSHGLPALLYDVGSKGAQGYLSLAREILDALAARRRATAGADAAADHRPAGKGARTRT